MIFTTWTESFGSTLRNYVPTLPKQLPKSFNTTTLDPLSFSHFARINFDLVTLPSLVVSYMFSFWPEIETLKQQENQKMGFINPVLVKKE